MNNIVYAAYDSHPLLTALSYLPFIFLSVMFFLFALLMLGSAWRYGKERSFAPVAVGLFIFFLCGTATTLWYSTPSILKHVDLKPQYAEPLVTEMFGKRLTDSKTEYNYVINLLKFNFEYNSFATQLAANIPHGKKVDVEVVNTQLLPLFYRCFTPPEIESEISVYGIERLIGDKEKICSTLASKELLANIQFSH